MERKRARKKGLHLARAYRPLGSLRPGAVDELHN